MKQTTSMTRSSLPAAKAVKARILIVEPYQVVRQGIAALINQQSDLVVCEEAADGRAALEVVALVKPDLVLMEITLRKGNGLELIKILSAEYPRLPVLVLSMHDESLYAELALRSGAVGYIMKTEPIEAVLTAIQRVLSGKLYLSDAVSAQMVRQQLYGRTVVKCSPVELLTNRELQVFQLIGQWRRTKEIATDLHLSVKTVEYHREKIREKLHLKDANELAHFATECAATGLALGQNSDKGISPHPSVSAK